LERLSRIQRRDFGRFWRINEAIKPNNFAKSTIGVKKQQQSEKVGKLEQKPEKNKSQQDEKAIVLDPETLAEGLLSAQGLFVTQENLDERKGEKENSEAVNASVKKLHSNSLFAESERVDKKATIEAKAQFELDNEEDSESEGETGNEREVAFE